MRLHFEHVLVDGIRWLSWISCLCGMLTVASCGGCSDTGDDATDGGGSSDAGDASVNDDAAAPDATAPVVDATVPLDDAGPPDDAGAADAGDGGTGTDGGPLPDGGPLGCGDCHGDETTPAPPLAVDGSSDTSARGVGAHREHLTASPTWHRQVLCEDCHVVPESVDAPGHDDTPLPAELTFSALASSDGASPSFDGVTCTGVYCHGDTLEPGGYSTQPEWARVDGEDAGCGACHGLPPGGTHPPQHECWTCHGEVLRPDLTFPSPELHINGTVEVTCGGCHGLPPDTGSHAVHAALAEPVYGGLGTAGDLGSPTGYAFGCGHCHPLDPARHMDGGPADIELFDPAAPSDSLKSRSPTARYVAGDATLTDDDGLEYTLGTCVDAPCHGGTVTSTGPVPAPGDPGFPFAGYPISYPPYAVDRILAYAPARWGDSLSCGGCHGYPPRMEYPAGEAGAGESHSYIDASGFENLHMWNHGWAPIPCRTCHAATLTEAAAFTRDSAGVATLSDVPIAAFDRHVNGTVDVVFDTVNALGYRTPLELTGAAYDPSTRTCSDVACHLRETSVVFGAPYRYGNSYECNRCHRY